MLDFLLLYHLHSVDASFPWSEYGLSNYLYSYSFLLFRLLHPPFVFRYPLLILPFFSFLPCFPLRPTFHDFNILPCWLSITLRFYLSFFSFCPSAFVRLLFPFLLPSQVVPFYCSLHFSFRPLPLSSAWDIVLLDVALGHHSGNC